MLVIEYDMVILLEDFEDGPNAYNDKINYGCLGKIREHSCLG